MPNESPLTRLRAEYLEMPGLRLTIEQAQRLCGVELAACKSVLDELVDAKFLSKNANGVYARLFDGESRPRHPLTADATFEPASGRRRAP